MILFTYVSFDKFPVPYAIHAKSVSLNVVSVAIQETNGAISFKYVDISKDGWVVNPPGSFAGLANKDVIEQMLDSFVCAFKNHADEPIEESITQKVYERLCNTR